MTKIKIKCFGNSYHKFESKEDIFRNDSNYPVCADCLIEFLEDFWDDEFAEYIFDEIKNKFNRNYNKWHKWFFENHIICNGEHDDYDNYYEHKDSITIIDDKNYCRYCIDKLEEHTDFKDDKKIK